MITLELADTAEDLAQEAVFSGVALVQTWWLEVLAEHLRDLDKQMWDLKESSIQHAYLHDVQTTTIKILDKQTLELDHLLNGEDAPTRASLKDLVDQVREISEEAKRHVDELLSEGWSETDATPHKDMQIGGRFRRQRNRQRGVPCE